MQAEAPAASSYKKTDFELYTLTTWLLQVGGQLASGVGVC